MISKPIKYIFLLGETGTGKSSFINLLTNYCKGNLDVKNLKIAIPTPNYIATENFKSRENDLSDSTKSKTCDCFTYTFDMHDFILNIIDSPGLNDTDGYLKDEKNMELILQTIGNLEEISAIFIIINGSISRLTLNIQNILVKIKGNLPNSILSNLGFILTNSWSDESNFNLDLIKDYLKPKNSNLFYINNSAFSRPPSEIDEKGWRRSQSNFEECFEVVDSIMKYIDDFNSVTSNDFIKMKNLRNNIKTRTHEIKLEISKLIKVHDEIIIAEAQLLNYADDEKKFQNYTETKIIDTFELVDSDYHSTICSTCNSVCHDRCGLSETVQVGNNIFTGCLCMTGPSDTCGVCKNKCSYTTHYHARKTMMKTQSTLQNVLQDVKAKYDAAIAGKQSAQNKINTAKNSKLTIEAAINQKSKSVLDECREIKKMCSGFNFVNEIKCLVDQMEMENASITNLEARNKADDFIRALTTLADTLSKN